MKWISFNNLHSLLNNDAYINCNADKVPTLSQLRDDLLYKQPIRKAVSVLANQMKPY